MISPPSSAERCKLVVNEWRKQLILTDREKGLLRGELKILDNQINRLNHKHLRLAAFGRVGVGKSSLLNAIVNKEIFSTDVVHGCTRNSQSIFWDERINNLESIELVDTPGIDEIESKARARLAARIALQVDLVLLVIDSDITRVELEALAMLLKSGKQIVLVLNRCDQWQPSQRKAVLRSIRKRLPTNACNLDIKVVAAAPKKVRIRADGRVRSEKCCPKIQPLLSHLKNLLSEKGELLLAVNTLRQSEKFFESFRSSRLKHSKAAAQGLIGKFAAFKASSIAANPLVILDLACGIACDTALVIQLSQLYGLQMRGHAARKLLKRVSVYNTLIGGAQISIQVALSVVRQLLILSTPITGGLSLASAAPVAIAQAALAVHTTKITGRLAAQMLLSGNHIKNSEPTALLQRLAAKDPQIKVLLKEWPGRREKLTNELQALLP